jgi:thiosulfate/3-mercaptopyruvate sulfurtransferase
MKGWTTIVAPETLAVAMSRTDVVVVDCRFSLADPGAGEHAWLQGHIPGAVYAHLDRDLSDLTRHGEGRHPLPEAEAFCGALSRWGIESTDQVVAYDTADGSLAAARLWWMLKLLGHEKVAVLDGGYTRWTTLGLPVESRVKRRAASRYAGSFDRGRIATAEDVLTRLDESPGWLIDARSPERFRGESEPFDKRAGHIPGAVNRPLGKNFASDGSLRRPADLATEFRSIIDGRAPDQVVLMCGSGVSACQNLLAMERAGLTGARIYAGSWSGWISDPERPIATGE